MRKVSIHITREQQDAIIAACANILQTQRREALDNAADLADKLHNATSDVAKHQLKNQRHDVLGHAIEIGAVSPGTQLHQALGYLSTWSLPGEVDEPDHCFIHVANTGTKGEPELIATYYKGEPVGNPRFVLAAVYLTTIAPAQWSFHS